MTLELPSDSDARVVTVPPFILTFFIVPVPELSEKYTLVESIAIRRGEFAGVRVVTVPPFIPTFFTKEDSFQYTLVESTAIP